ncbi:MAG: hypothetical protein NTX95_00960 [Actinobacteria bacterium]|nr:hypothetical protein [Actinomycetota bacterium]
MASAERVLLAMFSLVSLAASTALWSSTGSLQSPERGGLLFTPLARFSDLTDLIAFAVSGFPYGRVVDGVATGGPAYPPGTFVFMRILGELSEVSAVYTVVLMAGAAVAVLAGPVLCAAFNRRKRWAAATIGFSTTLLTSFTLDFYGTLLVGVSAALLLILAMSVRWNSISHIVGIPMMLGACYPIAFGIDRMNLDVIVFALVALAILLLRRGNGNWAAAALGAAIAMKVYPLYFAVADVNDRGRTVRLLIAVTAGITFTLAGFMTMHYSPYEAKGGFDNSIAFFEEHYIIGSIGMEHSGSLFTAIKITYRESVNTSLHLFATSMYSHWRMWSPVALGSLAALTLILRLPPWCRLMVMTSALLVLAPSSGMYRATMVLIPVAMWMGYLALRGGQKPSTRLELLLAALIGIGLAPLTLWRVAGFPAPNDITSESLLAPMIFSAILITSLLVGLQQRNRLFESRPYTLKSSKTAALNHLSGLQGSTNQNERHRTETRSNAI